MLGLWDLYRAHGGTFTAGKIFPAAPALGPAEPASPLGEENLVFGAYSDGLSLFNLQYKLR